MHSTSFWYLPHSASLQSLWIFANILLTSFAHISTEFENFATNSYMYRKRAYGALIWPQSVRFIANVLIANVSVVLFSYLIIKCRLSLAWFQVEKCPIGAISLRLTRPNGGSKFQVLLHYFPSLRQVRQQCQETCTFNCALQEQKAIPEGRAAQGTKYAPETESFCRWILMATCSLLQLECFREDFLITVIRQLVWTSIFFMRRHGCNRHTWLTWAKENGR